MKKIISVLLSVIMVFSCFSVIAFAGKTPDESDGFDFDLSELIKDKLNEGGFKDALENFKFDNDQIAGKDIEEMIQNGEAKDVNFLGLSLDYLYNSSEPLFWPSVSISKNDLAIARGNLNTYLLNVLKNKFYGDKLYYDKYATPICNFIGHLLYVNYEDKEIHFANGWCEKEEFFATIARESGLTDIITKNWCPFLTTTCNYKPLLYTLGVKFNDFPVPDRDITDGAIVARILLQSAIETIMQVGPINYLLDVLWAFSRTYNMFLIQPVEALFKVKLEANVITKEELSTFKGLFNLIANNNKPEDISKLQFITPPSIRFGVSKDTTELFLYLMIYLNLVGQYGQNANAVDLMEQKISKSTVLNSQEKSRVKTILEGFFKGNTAGVVDLLQSLLGENIDNAGKSIWITLKQYLADIYKSIVSIFDRIYKSLKSIF